jgi:FtsZ-binding cell division protein ZapB
MLTTVWCFHITMENNMGIAELIAEMNQVTETVEDLREKMEPLEETTASVFEQMDDKLNQIINALKTLQSRVDPTKLQVRNDNLDFQNVMDWMIFKVFDYYAPSDVDRFVNNCIDTFRFRGRSSLVPNH